MSRRLHIVQIGHDPSLFAAGAPSDSLARQLGYARELSAQRPGGELSVLSFVKRTDVKPLHLENLTCIPVSARPPWSLVHLWKALRRLHRSDPIDVIATQTVHEEAALALWFARGRGIRVIGQVHYDLFSSQALRQQLGGGPLGALRRYGTRRNLRRFWALRVVGQRVGRQLIQAVPGVRVAVIPVPVTMSAATSAQARHGSAAALPLSGEPSVLFVGRLAWEKDLDLWLEVAAQVRRRMPEAVFDIVGDGPQRRHLETLARVLGLGGHVRFHGFVAYEQLPAHYRGAGAFLLTSHYEGFGRVLVEALLHELPVVAVAIAGVEDIVADGQNGFLHPRAEVSALAQSLVRVLEDQELRHRLGVAGRARVIELFDPGRLTRQWVQLLVEAAEART